MIVITCQSHPFSDLIQFVSWMDNPLPYSVISCTSASCRVALVTLPCIISKYAGLMYSPALKSTWVWDTISLSTGILWHRHRFNHSSFPFQILFSQFSYWMLRMEWWLKTTWAQFWQFKYLVPVKGLMWVIILLNIWNQEMMMLCRSKSWRQGEIWARNGLSITSTELNAIHCPPVCLRLVTFIEPIGVA